MAFPSERKEIPRKGGVSEEGPKGVFVSDSGAWHISGRNSKVHAKIFYGMHKLKAHAEDKHFSDQKKGKKKL